MDIGELPIFLVPLLEVLLDGGTELGSILPPELGVVFTRRLLSVGEFTLAQGDGKNREAGVASGPCGGVSERAVRGNRGDRVDRGFGHDTVDFASSVRFGGTRCWIKIRSK